MKSWVEVLEDFILFKSDGSSQASVKDQNIDENPSGINEDGPPTFPISLFAGCEGGHFRDTQWAGTKQGGKLFWLAVQALSSLQLTWVQRDRGASTADMRGNFLPVQLLSWYRRFPILCHFTDVHRGLNVTPPKWRVACMHPFHRTGFYH